MNEFAFVLEFKKNRLININVRNAARSEYCKISNHGPLEQNPGLELDLTVLLYESLYDS